MGHKYKLKYKVDYERGEFTSDDVKKDKNNGGTDAIIVHSLIFPEDGSLSHNFYSVDGRTKEALNSTDTFKAWAMMGFSLSERDDLKTWQRIILEGVTDSIRASILRIAKQDEPPDTDPR